MTLTEYPELEQGSPEWLEQRRGMITASVVGRLITTRTRQALDYGCGECGAFPTTPCVSKRDQAPIKTVHPARAEMARLDEAPPDLIVADTEDSRGLTSLLVAERIAGWVDPVHVSDDMWRGTLHEPIARDVYAEHHGVTVTTTGFMVRREDGWTLGYSPDGLVGDDGLLEVKCPRAKKHVRTILSGEVPAEHMPQLQAALLVSGRRWVDFVSFCGGLPLFVKRVTPDDRWQTAIVAAATRFEQTAAEMVAAYQQATNGLPDTERVEMDMVI